MWTGFFATSALCAAFLFVPAYFLLRSFSCSRFEALVYAPFIDVVVYSVLAIAYEAIGVNSSWATLSLPPLLLATLTFGMRAACSGERRAPLVFPSRRWVLIPLLYVCAGVVISLIVFLPSLETPDSFVREYDNIHHLGVTCGYLRDGNWSSLQTTLYPTVDDQAISPFDYAEYYPSAWNCLAAMAAQLTGATATAAVNAMNFSITAVIYPVCMYAFMRTLFGSRSLAVLCGALFCLAFSAMPWAMLVFGPLYPNMFAFSLLPSMLSGFILIFDRGLPRFRRFARVVLFAAAVASCVFTQPNAAFSAGVLLIPFCVFRIAVSVGGERGFKRFRCPLVLASCIAFLLLVALLWIALHNASFMQGVVTHYWPAFRTLEEAVADVATGSYRLDVPQIMLSVLVVIGVAVAFREKACRWLVASWLLSVCIYVICVSSDGAFRFLVSGFWYNDSLRIAAFAAIAGVPLAALGFEALVKWIMRIIGKVGIRSTRSSLLDRGVLSLAVIVAFVLIYRPVSAVSLQHVSFAAFPHLTSVLNAMYNPLDSDVYDAEERAFVQEVKRIVPEGSLILNVADDGSAFAYSADGLNIYYRYLSDYDTEYESDDSRLIRNGLVRISEDGAVRDAVERTGSEYVLFLDWGDDSLSPTAREFFFTYGDGGKWRGMLDIDEETPGFDLILSCDDMRLFRINA